MFIVQHNIAFIYNVLKKGLQQRKINLSAVQRKELSDCINEDLSFVVSLPFLRNVFKIFHTKIITYVYIPYRSLRLREFQESVVV